MGSEQVGTWLGTIAEPLSTIIATLILIKATINAISKGVFKLVGTHKERKDAFSQKKIFEITEKIVDDLNDEIGRNADNLVHLNGVLNNISGRITNIESSLGYISSNVDIITETTSRNAGTEGGSSG